MLAKASTISHECIKQYGTKLIWSELLIKITDCIKWSSFISAALTEPSCGLMHAMYYWPTFHWTTTIKAAEFCCFTSDSNCPLMTGGNDLLIQCWAQIILHNFTIQASEITFQLLKVEKRPWICSLPNSLTVALQISNKRWKLPTLHQDLTWNKLNWTKCFLVKFRGRNRKRNEATGQDGHKKSPTITHAHSSQDMYI